MLKQASEKPSRNAMKMTSILREIKTFVCRKSIEKFKGLQELQKNLFGLMKAGSSVSLRFAVLGIARNVRKYASIERTKPNTTIGSRPRLRPVSI